MDLVHDPSAKVRLQLACTLGEWPEAETGQALGRLAVSDAEDPFLSAAIISSINRQNIDMVLKVVRAERSDAFTGALVGRLLALSVALGNREAILDALDRLVQPEKERDRSWQFGTVAGVMDALEKRETNLAKLAASDGNRGKDMLRRVEELTSHARSTATDGQATVQDRIAGLRLMGREGRHRPDDLRLLGNLLVPRPHDDHAA